MNLELNLLAKYVERLLVPYDAAPPRSVDNDGFRGLRGRSGSHR